MSAAQRRNRTPESFRDLFLNALACNGLIVLGLFAAMLVAARVI